MKLEQLISLPAILVGIGMMYVGYSETDYIYLFFYSLLGFSLAVIGVLILLGYDMFTKSKKVKSEAKTEGSGEEAKEPVAKPLEYCANCGSPLVSAGKFCGTCGSPIITKPKPRI